MFYEEPPLRVASPEEHEKGFNIYEVPFPNLKLELAIEDLNYHRYKIKDFKGTFRIQQDHYVFQYHVCMRVFLLRQQFQNQGP